MIERLLEAYATLMSRAPGAAFRKARALYLHKYPLPQADEQSPLKLFVCDEQLTETVEPVESGDLQRRLVTLRSTPGALALVHWQQNDPAPDDLVRHYLRQSWGLNPEALILKAWSELWFRNGGHQIRITPPTGLFVQRQSLLSLSE
jgi:hypothetical protein